MKERPTLPLLELAVRSQFFLLTHRRQSRSRMKCAHGMECHHIEIKVRGLAIIVFAGMAAEMGYQSHQVALYLKIDDRLHKRYCNYYQQEFSAAMALKEAGIKLNPESTAGKVFNKTGLVESWLRWNG